MPELFFELVKLGDEFDNRRCAGFTGFEGFDEFPADMSHAAGTGHRILVFAVAAVNAVAVALQDTFPVRTYGFDEGVLATAFVPPVADAFPGGVCNPEVASFGFACAGGELADRGLVDLQVGLGEDFAVDGFGHGAEQFEAFERPVVEAVTGDVDASLFEHFRLTVKREMKGVFAEDEFARQLEGGQAADEWAGWGGGEDRCLVPVCLELEFWADGEDLAAVSETVVELFGDFASNEFVGFGVCQVGIRIHGVLNGFEIVEAFDAAVVPILFCRAFCCGGLLRYGCFFGGGLGLF